MAHRRVKKIKVCPDERQQFYPKEMCEREKVILLYLRHCKTIVLFSTKLGIEYIFSEWDSLWKELIMAENFFTVVVATLHMNLLYF